MPREKILTPQDTLDQLTEAVRAYISEFDNPVADFGYRKMLRDRLRTLVGAPPQPTPRLSD